MIKQAAFGKPLKITTSTGSYYQIDPHGRITETNSKIGDGYRVRGAADDKYDRVDEAIITVGRRLRIAKHGYEGLTSVVVTIEELT